MRAPAAAALGGLLAALAAPAFASGALDLEARVAAQRAIDAVYARHRSLPGRAPSDVVLRGKVENYLLESAALERIRGRPLQAGVLGDEVARMTRFSRAPGVLREIFEALGNDREVIAECLARPLLADRLLRQAYARDPAIHAPLRRAVEAYLAEGKPLAEAVVRGGDYHESVFVEAGGGPRTRRGRSREPREIRLDPSSWQRLRARLRAAAPAVQEDDESLYVQSVLVQSPSRLRVATASWRKRPFDAWWGEMKERLRADVLDGPISLATPGADTIVSSCIDDTWSAVAATGAPTPREAHTVVWTGAEMIVWGGYDAAPNLDTSTGGRYDPATDAWSATSTVGAPDPRDTHTAIWTGTEMLVWGGGDEIFRPKDSGGRYDPATDTWQPMSTTGAPSAREYHTAVWAGSAGRMIVWGGWDGARDLDTGGRYDPVADAWSPTTKSGAPDRRDGHTAVWTGGAMVVWGGEDDAATTLATGGRYDPLTNSWVTTADGGAPSGRVDHSAVWTGSRMIVWGGFDGLIDLATGGRYDPVADHWTPTGVPGSPSPRDRHTAVWAAPAGPMIVWGGQDDLATPLGGGGRYDPATDAWTAISISGAPDGRRFHTAVWAGASMIVWGGWRGVDLDSGGRYCLSSCASTAPTGTPALSAVSEPGGSLISWSAVASASGYDVVRGGLGILHGTGGDFAASTQACLADDQALLSLLDADVPPAGDGFWYLARAVSCGGPGSYDDPAPANGARDAGIAASPNACP